MALLGLSERPAADRAEIEALPLLARGSALRFFLTRLYDWLMTPAGALVVKKDPLEYLKKLRFHRSVEVHPPNTGPTRQCLHETCRYLHRWSLLRQSGPRRLGRCPALWRDREGPVRRRSRDDQQPHGASGGDHRAERAERASARSISTPTANTSWTASKWIHGWKKNGWKTADKKPVKNGELWQALDVANQSHKVTWHWVKGHAGHPENERADELARKGMEPFKKKR
jgi:hypothetical protein